MRLSTSTTSSCLSFSLYSSSSFRNSRTDRQRQLSRRSYDCIRQLRLFELVIPLPFIYLDLILLLNNISVVVSSYSLVVT
ncbi:hypothetical protein WAI453_006123 [Rhynchosporium graminicola]